VPERKPQGKAGLLTRKKGPLPVWAWLILASLAGWYLWKRLGSNVASQNPAASSAQQTATGPPATDNSGATSGDGSASGGLSAQDLASALGASNDSLAQMFAQSLADNNAQLEAWWQLQQQPQEPPTTTTTPTTTPTTKTPPAIAIYHPVSGKTHNFAAAAVAQTHTLQAAGQAAPFGGVVAVHRLRNGSTVTTYASGRKVQQAPGKSAYVIHK
jgi:hypothetical protein